jgi:glutamate-ammonia-ligase adenylyltransferase
VEAEIEKLISGLPDRHAARRFLDALAEKHPSQFTKLTKNRALLSDAATLVSFSPLLAATMLQNPDYLWWLNRERAGSGVRSKDEMMESLARFSLTHSQIEPSVVFARFRRRELLRIYLRDIRRLATIAEITEEISNLADAILEAALKFAVREMDNRFGSPLETDEKGRSRPARFCIVALGKLGSRELNYSSDIDLIFLYSNEGKTSGRGTRGAVTNREYFVKIAEHIVKQIGEPAGEGGAYRVDLRLRPHGTLGALALSVGDTVRYYREEARGWERQVMIRSRGCAGSIELFKEFFSTIEGLVFPKNESVESALANVKRSKEKIDLENIDRRGYNVKLGRGGIREIEFIAQALQLAHGGADAWLRSPHTLISIARLADRHHLSAAELQQLSTAYEVLRRTEHILQMENGVQTHTVPDEPEKRALVAARMTFASGGNFEHDLKTSSDAVRRIFDRVFEGVVTDQEANSAPPLDNADLVPSERKIKQREDRSDRFAATMDRAAKVSPHFAAMLASQIRISQDGSGVLEASGNADYLSLLTQSVDAAGDLGLKLAAMRQTWSKLLLSIALDDIEEKIPVSEVKQKQTQLAEASIDTALRIVRDELSIRHKTTIDHLNLAVLALGKLGGRGLDYFSDLDLVLIYDDTHAVPAGVSHAEFYGRAVELFVTALSAMTRDGNLYRVDLRLRPYGSKGLSSISSNAFVDYIRETAEIWEMLAFVKLRAVGGDTELGQGVESETRRIIHRRAAAADPAGLRDETVRVRNALEKQRLRSRRPNEIDIKYGSGGMLDVYFAMRYLQLRDNVPDDDENRSTSYMLGQLKEKGSLAEATYNELSSGYEFLSMLDHTLRLTVGRTTRLPLSNQSALELISTRLAFPSPSDMLENLTLHRLAIRAAFEDILR